MENAITQGIVPWWVLPLILVLLSAVAWLLVPPWLERKIQDPDAWWDNKRMEALMVLAKDHETMNRMESIRTAFIIHYCTLHELGLVDKISRGVYRATPLGVDIMQTSDELQTSDEQETEDVDLCDKGAFDYCGDGPPGCEYLCVRRTSEEKEGES